MLDHLLAGFEGVIEHDLRLERNRLLHRGDQLLGTQARPVFDNAGDRFLSGLLLDHLGLITLSSELSGERLLAVLTFLDNLGFPRRQVRVLTNLSRERDRYGPRHVLRAFGRLSAHANNLVDRFFNALPRAVLVLFFLTRLALGINLVLASRQRVVVFVFDLERNLTRRHVHNLDHGNRGVPRAIRVGHRDGDLRLVSGLRILRRGRGDRAVIINRYSPACRNITHRERVVLGNLDVFRLINRDRQLRGTARVDRLRRI